MLPTVAGMERDVRPVQDLKADVSMVCNPSLREMEVKPVQLAKAYSPIVRSDVGNVSEVRD